MTDNPPPPYITALGHLQAYVQISRKLLADCDELFDALGVSPGNSVRKDIASALAGDFPWQPAMPRPKRNGSRR